jgi:hypothetical protein
MVLPSPQRNSGALSEPALGRVLVVPNYFHLRMMEATVFLGTFNAADIVLVCFPRSSPVLRHNPVPEFHGQSFDLIAWYLL